jgi:hypothetical protein
MKKYPDISMECLACPGLSVFFSEIPSEELEACECHTHRVFLFNGSNSETFRAFCVP